MHCPRWACCAFADEDEDEDEETSDDEDDEGDDIEVEDEEGISADSMARCARLCVGWQAHAPPQRVRARLAARAST